MGPVFQGFTSLLRAITPSNDTAVVMRVTLDRIERVHTAPRSGVVRRKLKEERDGNNVDSRSESRGGADI
jgi:hypothetical protein